MKTFRSLFFIVFLVLIPTSETGAGQKRRPPLGTSMASTSEEVSSSVASEENEKIEEQCSLPDRPRPEVEVKRYAILCGKAISLPKPSYPEDAKAAKASGQVTVQVVIDEEGRMIWARAIDGHPLLREASVKAACRARFTPVKISGRAVKADGAISYNFVAP